mmetsp:Transcript_35627/g.93127  ORF Transcript_35627/g.93127 Transcript_35627/m.93127 type:complete len:207 (-) Transcript_35627:368-988(-)
MAIEWICGCLRKRSNGIRWRLQRARRLRLWDGGIAERGPWADGGNSPLELLDRQSGVDQPRAVLLSLAVITGSCVEVFSSGLASGLKRSCHLLPGLVGGLAGSLPRRLVRRGAHCGLERHQTSGEGSHRGFRPSLLRRRGGVEVDPANANAGDLSMPFALAGGAATGLGLGVNVGVLGGGDDHSGIAGSVGRGGMGSLRLIWSRNG